jgi:putative nucleotidyltransferase with HDIG domain
VNISQEQPKRKRIRKAVQVFTQIADAPEKVTINEPLLFELGELADAHNIELYVVGGYVRDYFLNKPRKDIDCTVVGDAVKFSKIVAEKYNSKTVIYERFRTAMVPIGEYQVEFVGTRKEVYLPNSRNPVVTEGTLIDDLRRRDFTINAMAVSLNKLTFGLLTDLFDGKADIEAKILRTPLDPGVTFNEDPLRMLRAARFSSQLDFDLAPQCYHQIERMAERIKIISQERISDEFLKIIDSPKPSIGLSLLFETGLLRTIFPELQQLSGVEIKQEGEKTFGHKDVFHHSLKVLDNIALTTDNRWLRFAALVHDIAKPRTKRFIEGIGWSFHGHEELGARLMNKIFRRMKFPLDHLDFVERLIRLHQRPMQLVDEGVSDSAVRRLAFHAGEYLDDLFTLVRADITTKNPDLSEKYKQNYEKVFRKVVQVQEKDKLREFQSPVRGEEIMMICEIEPSKVVGLIKNRIEEAILDGIIPNNYDEAKEYFITNKKTWLKELVPPPIPKKRGRKKKVEVEETEDVDNTFLLKEEPKVEQDSLFGILLKDKSTLNKYEAFEKKYGK